MKKRFLIASIVGLMLLASLFAFAHVASAHAQTSTRAKPSGTAVPFTQEDEVGYWQSVSCDSTRLMGVNTGSVFFRRFYVISLTSAVVRYSFYTDAACQHPLYSFRIFAWNELGKILPNLPQTRAALVVYSTVLLTADSSQGRQVLSSCGASSWAIGQEYDVTAQGCLAVGLHPRSSCIGDYDLERMENHSLMTFGYRTANMCTAAGQPTQTQISWVKRVSPQAFQG